MNFMRLEVLISCMYEKDASIIYRTGIQSDVLVINQCDHDGKEQFEFKNKKGEVCLARIINTKERGLSKSRNMALKYAKGDVCLLCDDDEEMEPDYVEKILQSFQQYENCGILAFAMYYPTRKYRKKPYKINIFNAAKLSSVQIAVRRKKIPSAVRFNEQMGSGTGNGGGEENKFVVDCLRHGVKAFYVPYYIATVAQVKSQWMDGYNQHYWTNRGWSARMIYGWRWGFLYILYTILLRCWKIEHENAFCKKAWWLSRGFFSKR